MADCSYVTVAGMRVHTDDVAVLVEWPGASPRGRIVRVSTKSRGKKSGVYTLKQLNALVRQEGCRLRVAVVDGATYPGFGVQVDPSLNDAALEEAILANHVRRTLIDYPGRDDGELAGVLAVDRRFRHGKRGSRPGDSTDAERVTMSPWFEVDGGIERASKTRLALRRSRQDPVIAEDHKAAWSGAAANDRLVSILTRGLSYGDGPGVSATNARQMRFMLSRTGGAKHMLDLVRKECLPGFHDRGDAIGDAGLLAMRGVVDLFASDPDAWRSSPELTLALFGDPRITKVFDTLPALGYASESQMAVVKSLSAESLKELIPLVEDGSVLDMLEALAPEGLALEAMRHNSPDTHRVVLAARESGIVFDDARGFAGIGVTRLVDMHDLVKRGVRAEFLPVFVNVGGAGSHRALVEILSSPHLRSMARARSPHQSTPVVDAQSVHDVLAGYVTSGLDVPKGNTPWREFELLAGDGLPPAEVARYVGLGLTTADKIRESGLRVDDPESAQAYGKLGWYAGPDGRCTPPPELFEACKSMGFTHGEALTLARAGVPHQVAESFVAVGVKAPALLAAVPLATKVEHVHIHSYRAGGTPRKVVSLAPAVSPQEAAGILKVLESAGMGVEDACSIVGQSSIRSPETVQGYIDRGVRSGGDIVELDRQRVSPEDMAKYQSAGFKDASEIVRLKEFGVTPTLALHIYDHGAVERIRSASTDASRTVDRVYTEAGAVLRDVQIGRLARLGASPEALRAVFDGKAWRGSFLSPGLSPTPTRKALDDPTSPESLAVRDTVRSVLSDVFGIDDPDEPTPWEALELVVEALLGEPGWGMDDAQLWSKFIAAVNNIPPGE